MKEIINFIEENVDGKTMRRSDGSDTQISLRHEKPLKSKGFAKREKFSENISTHLLLETDGFRLALSSAVNAYFSMIVGITVFCQSVSDFIKYYANGVKNGVKKRKSYKAIDKRILFINKIRSIVYIAVSKPGDS